MNIVQLHRRFASNEFLGEDIEKRYERMTVRQFWNSCRCGQHLIKIAGFVCDDDDNDILYRRVVLAVALCLAKYSYHAKDLNPTIRKVKTWADNPTAQNKRNMMRALNRDSRKPPHSVRESVDHILDTLTLPKEMAFWGLVHAAQEARIMTPDEEGGLDWGEPMPNETAIRRYAAIVRETIPYAMLDEAIKRKRAAE